MTGARVLLFVAVALATVCAAPAASRFGIDGRFFTSDGRTFRPLFTSALSILTRPAAERATVLDEARALGFNGVRVFAGALTWAKQTPEGARAALPELLAEADRRGLAVEVTAITDSRTGYDVGAHLQAVSRICAAAPNCLLEAANEYYHPTQSDLVQDAARLYALGRESVGRMPWSLGAPPFDALQGGKWPIPSADFITVHLDRGRPFWGQLASVRSLAAIAEHTGKPVLNNEPIGAAERAERGRRESDPQFFFALGALSRLFELGVVFHSEDGLNARPLGPNQRRAAEALVAGFNSIGTTARLTARPIEASPIARVSNAAHVFAATDGNQWWVILLDAERATVTVRDGWSSRAARRAAVQTVEIRPEKAKLDRR
ncbi:MAG TPA: hypothetical protein VF147_19915 [Vicinamibacterales bacterium]